MVKTLHEKEVYFDFYLQFQEDADTMPIEDPTIKWKSEFIKVARIKILKQTFDTEERDRMGEDFSFSPWHTLPQHRPIGGMNRARKMIYESLANFRRIRNGVSTEEPQMLGKKEFY